MILFTRRGRGRHARGRTSPRLPRRLPGRYRPLLGHFERLSRGLPVSPGETARMRVLHADCLAWMLNQQDSE